MADVGQASLLCEEMRNGDEEWRCKSSIPAGLKSDDISEGAVEDCIKRSNSRVWF